MKQIVQIVMLPTNEAHLFYHDCNQKLSYKLDKYNECKKSKCRHPQHLYLTSNEEIKEGDWCITTLDGGKTKSITQCKEEGGIQNGYCKIIATTDKSLIKKNFFCAEAYNNIDQCLKQCGKCSLNEIEYRKLHDSKKGEVYIETLLPQIPESFVKAFVKAQDRITEVLVEFEANKYPDLHGVKYDLKLREDNTVIIHEAKKYSREEIIILLKKCNNEGGMNIEVMDKWIEQNL